MSDGLRGGEEVTAVRPVNPLCFVLMPFGQKPDLSGGTIDFDAVYGSLIRPAIEQAGLKPIRADMEKIGGIIHKPMFERLILCDFAVADLTTANANVFYELGVRHAIRPRTTVSVFAEGASRLPFDVQNVRAVPYSLSEGKPNKAAEDLAKLAAMLEAAQRAEVTDSPVYQLLSDLVPADLGRLKTDVFREQVDFALATSRHLEAARTRGEAAVDEVRVGLGPLENLETGVVIDLFLSYRAVEAWEAMIALVDEMPPPLVRSALVREQLGLALNRVGRRDEGERTLLDLIDEQGPSSETYGILGRVYKDQWAETREVGEEILARGLLVKAIDAYLKGFEADWRDAYPGVNAVTLMELSEPPDPRREQLLPVVRYSVNRRFDLGRHDYWDHAALLELAVLDSDHDAARHHAADAVAAAGETWELDTTLRNLRLISAAREARGEPTDWIDPIKKALESRMLRSRR